MVKNVSMRWLVTLRARTARGARSCRLTGYETECRAYSMRATQVRWPLGSCVGQSGHGWKKAARIEPFCVAARPAKAGCAQRWCRASQARGLGTEAHAEPALLSDAASGKALRDFFVPQPGEGIHDVEIIEWHVREGDHVHQFDKLLDAQSDKATITIESRFDGKVVDLMFQKGDIAKVGDLLCRFEVDGDDHPEASLDASRGGTADLPTGLVPSSSPEVKPTISDATQTRGTETNVLAAPPVRLLARELGINLALVQGTGSQGRITRQDVLAYHTEGRESMAAGMRGSDSSAPHPAQAPRVGDWISEQHQRVNDLGNDVEGAGEDTIARAGQQERLVQPIRGLMRAMVRSMTASAQIPQLVLGEEVIMDELVKLKRDLAPVLETRGIRLTYLPILIKACSMSLEAFPILNASVDDACENITYKMQHNISIAMDSPQGLIVPNIKNVNKLTVADIARELARIQNEVRNMRFAEADLEGGTFALSNIGSIGGTYTSPLIMPPQVAIGAIGRIRNQLMWDEATAAPTMRRVCAVSWSADHRIIDGATMANFSNHWKALVEKPGQMLLHLR